MSQADYARLRAVIEIRLGELRDALDRHEAERRLDRVHDLERVERALVELVELVS